MSKAFDYMFNVLNMPYMVLKQEFELIFLRTISVHTNKRHHKHYLINSVFTLRTTGVATYGAKEAIAPKDFLEFKCRSVAIFKNRHIFDFSMLSPPPTKNL